MLQNQTVVLQFKVYNGEPEAATYDSNSKNNGSKDVSGQGAGGDQQHENRPPYYALAFVMRIK